MSSSDLAPNDEAGKTGRGHVALGRCRDLPRQGRVHFRQESLDRRAIAFGDELDGAVRQILTT